MQLYTFRSVASARDIGKIFSMIQDYIFGFVIKIGLITEIFRKKIFWNYCVMLRVFFEIYTFLYIITCYKMSLLFPN